ncbi:MAG TPA: SbcC/MukB-like Walker B domain-containing protein [Polyangiales bacterium]|nr:SbcC/MukB-like Walker B domain-containing protein [Polyangiales bacterium]
MTRADATPSRAGFRLQRLELYNWGTFHQHVWTLAPGADNLLVTGDIGSGKSTIVDALTTLLVPPQRIAYNKAAGAEARERSLRSYVLGYYKSERGEAGLAARPVMLRGRNSYSVLLAVFHSEDLNESVTLAQVFWMRDPDGQPARLCVVADGVLSIGEDFAEFGSDLNNLRKRLRKRPDTEVEESFSKYAAAFRRRFGIENEQALDLFHQTVSMKSVGNLTEFVREHMLEAFPVEPRIAALVSHFDDLNRAHQSVLQAKAQIGQLEPLMADCERHTSVLEGIAAQREQRECLHAYFASLKRGLLDKRMLNLDGDLARLAERITDAEDQQSRRNLQRDDIKQAISERGGDRLARIEADVRKLTGERDARAQRSRRYEDLVHAVGLSVPSDADQFVERQRETQSAFELASEQRVKLDGERTDLTLDFTRLREQHGEVEGELTSLRRRRSNIPARMLALRTELCRALDLDEEQLPFAGELIQVRNEERDWEGAIERILHGFGLALLVDDALYPAVSQWVERTHLGGKLRYYRVRGQVRRTTVLHPDSLVHKLALKHDSQLYGWLEAEISARFNYACCETLEQFRRETVAVTRAGQVKGRGDQHEKDDRHRIDDRSRYVLGWSNEEKIAALEKVAHDLKTRLQTLADRLARMQADQKELETRIGQLQQLAMFDSFRELDWRSLVGEIERLQREYRELKAASDVLNTLQAQLEELERELAEVEKKLIDVRKEHTTQQLKREQAEEAAAACDAVLAMIASELRAVVFPELEKLRESALAAHSLSVESCDGREKDLREVLQKRIDADVLVTQRLGEKIVKAMEGFRRDYPLETQEVDANVAAAPEFRKMLERLRSDDLPRFEARFKQLLNENTIREVANFQSQLARERQTIKERIALINQSLREIDYNEGRYIELEPNPSSDVELRDFQQELRACTEGALTGSDDEAYSEGKFLQVQRIIERFRGREGSSELDRRWTRKVTDVRNWFEFSASERWREDGREHEHYTDSGGKSGGQKEKLAYTVLAASLVYQFGLDASGVRTRSFRFVVIDEAFGRGSDESARYGLELFKRLGLQLLIVTPLQKIHVIEPYVAGVGFIHNDAGRQSMLRNLTIEEYRSERAARAS